MLGVLSLLDVRGGVLNLLDVRAGQEGVYGLQNPSGIAGSGPDRSAASDRRRANGRVARCS